MQDQVDRRRWGRLTPRAVIMAGALGLVICGIALSAPADRRGQGSRSHSSPLTNRDAAYPPSNLSPPVIAGSAVQGQTLTEEKGSWTGSPTSYSYQWEACDGFGNGCSAISGSILQTYTVAAGDVGHTIRVQESASNAAGSSPPATSVQTTIVTTAALSGAPVSISPPEINGETTAGNSLSASLGSWSGAAPITYAYQWQHCGFTCVNVAGATFSSYKLGAFDVGAHLRVVVTASNANGVSQASSGVVGPIAPSAGQIRANLRRQVTPHGKAAKVVALRKKKAFVLFFSALSAGRAVIDWFYLPKGAHLANAASSPTLVAAGKATFSRAERRKITIKLTAKGKRLLKQSNRLKLTIKASFRPIGKTSVGIKKVVTLKQ